MTETTDRATPEFRFAGAFGNEFSGRPHAIAGFVFLRTNRDDIAMTANMAREAAVAIVRVADAIDPAGSFVKREPASAWKRAVEFPPPASGMILAADRFGHVEIVRRRDEREDWRDAHGPFVVFQWVEVPT